MKLPKTSVIVFICLGFASVIIGYKSCRITGKYAELKAAYEDAKKIAVADHEILTTTITEKGKEIDALTKQIAIIIENSHKPTAAEVAKDEELATLRKSWAGMSIECVTKLNGLDKAWSDKFTLAENRHKADLVNLNATWQKKFDAQVVITGNYKVLYEKQLALSQLAEKAMSAADMKIRTLQFGTNIKTIIVAVAAGYIGYRLITGK